MKPIKRLDENLDVRRNRIKVLRDERILISNDAFNKAKKEWDESAKGIELNKLQQEEHNYYLEQKRNKEKEFRRQMDKEYIRYSADRKDTKFKYAQRVIVVNPVTEGCGKHEADMKGLRGRIRNIGGCRCIHSISKQCYWVGITSTGETEHFEECELEKAETKNGNAR